MTTRRTLLTGLAALAAPAIICTPGLLMPVRRVAWPGLDIHKKYKFVYGPVSGDGDLSLSYPSDNIVEGYLRYGYEPVANMEAVTNLFHRMREMDEAASQVQKTGMAVDGPVQIEDIGNGMTMRSGWRCSPGIPNWMRRDDA